MSDRVVGSIVVFVINFMEIGMLRPFVSDLHGHPRFKPQVLGTPTWQAQGQYWLVAQQSSQGAEAQG